MESRIGGDTPEEGERKKKHREQKGRLRRAGNLEKALTPFPEKNE